MEYKIALAGNPNCGKTTLFNALTGSNQFVGNWPGVTVEKKEGKLKRHKDVIITDLPGIYSLSPYTLEEVVARNYLLSEHPNAILNIIDATNLERNLYLTTQLVELGIPVIVALNMMDVVKKTGDQIQVKQLEKELGCKVVEISALKGTGITEAADLAVQVAKAAKPMVAQHSFSSDVENTISHIEAELLHDVPEERKRWYAIKVFERDEKVLEQLKLSGSHKDAIEKEITAAEEKLDDDAESIITNERYQYISKLIKDCLRKKNKGGLTTSDKIDKVVTNRWLGLPIFAVIMFLVYYISMVTVGSAATDWANDGLFGDGWHLLGIGSGSYNDAAEEYGDTNAIIDGYVAYLGDEGVDTEELEGLIDTESDDFDGEAAKNEILSYANTYNSDFSYDVEDEETLEVTTETATMDDLTGAADLFAEGEPDPADYGVWVPGIPVLIEKGLDALNCVDWLKGLILDGIVAGVGAVLGFVPQMLVLFILLAILEACGYMARIAFVLDRIFRKFGLSGKSFIPILIGTGCGIPGIMASRTIENERDRRMTIMTTTFIPCGAKQPFIAMIAGAIFGGSAWIATGAYFLGMAAIIVSGIILKKTKMFAGDPAPFVMELPPYHVPTVGNVLRSMWERGWSFIKKAGTIITLSTIFVWFTSFFGWVDGSFQMLTEDQMSNSILAYIGKGICWIFAPLGWGDWQATVAAVTGLVAKENIVATMGILYGGGDGTYANLAAAFTGVAGMSFLIFNLLCAPCFAAMGAIKREMNNIKWFWFAIGYECGFAYVIALIVNQLGNLFTGRLMEGNAVVNVISLIVAFALIIALIYLLVRPYRESQTLSVKASRRSANN